jgi:hypothetical protein
MTLVDLIAQNKLTEAKEIIFNRLDEIAAEHLEEEKAYVASTTYGKIEDDEQLDEANVMRTGRIQKIRRRIRRNKKGQIVVQKKYMGSFALRGDDCPKLLGTSNFIVFNLNSISELRRLHICEIGDIGHYYPGELNLSWNSSKKMFDDWGQNDWLEFYNFIFYVSIVVRSIVLFLNHIET